MTQLEKRIYPKNPIGIIALFVFFIEAISTVSLKFLLDSNSEYVGVILSFIVIFPSAIAILFFVTLWFKRESLYGPGDFQDDSNFVQLLKKIEVVEFKQRASQIDPSDPQVDPLPIIVRLLENQEFESAINYATAYRKVRRFETSLNLFEYIKEATINNKIEHGRALENYAYSLIGLGRHAEAISHLEQLREIEGGTLDFWPCIAMSSSYLGLGDTTQSERWFKKASQLREINEYVRLIERDFPNLREYLQT